MIVLYISNFLLFSEQKKTKGCELNGSEHYPCLICSYFPDESRFDLLLLFPDICSLPP
jgi:hypothetical protein